MKNSIFEIFKIDSLKNRIFVRALFVILLLLNLWIVFIPVGDNNFDLYFAWMNKVMDNPELINSLDWNQIPLTEGNYVFLAVALAIALVDITASWLYTAIYIREYRIQKKLTNVISIPKLIFRTIIMMISCTILTSIFSVFVLYLGLIFIIIFPYLIMFSACYLSGDKSFFDSFKGMFKVTEGYYLTNSRNVSIIVLCYFVCELIVEGIHSVNPAAAAALVPFVNIFILLSLGRYVGMIYIRMLQVPGGFRILIEQLNNDVHKDDNSEN